MYNYRCSKILNRNDQPMFFLGGLAPNPRTPIRNNRDLSRDLYRKTNLYVCITYIDILTHYSIKLYAYINIYIIVCNPLGTSMILFQRF